MSSTVRENTGIGGTGQPRGAGRSDAWEAAPVPVEPAQVELILAQIDTLPTLSPVATRLLAMSTDERAGVRDLVRLVESDQSIAARILSAARRSHLGAEAGTVDRAVALLGFDAVRNITLSMQIFETFSHQVEDESKQFDRLGFWKHSLAVACAAKLLVEHGIGMHGTGAAARPEEAFFCGLLHDIGKVALAACFPKTYDRVVAKADAMLVPITDVEREMFGVDHTQAGRRLAQHWKLPRMIEECIWLHHHMPASTPSQIDYPTQVTSIQLADDLARQSRIGYSGTPAWSGPWAEKYPALQQAAEVMPEIRQALPERVTERAELIGLDRISSKEMYEEALARANGELSTINARLAEANAHLERRSTSLEALAVFKTHLAPDPSHENIADALVEGLRAVLPDMAVGAVAVSSHRGIAIVAGSAGAGGKLRLDAVPISRAGDLAHLAGHRGDWDPASELGGVLCDSLERVLGQAPTLCRVITGHTGVVGAIAMCAPAPGELDEAIDSLADWAGSWLGGAESRVTADKLNEELAEMNRRLVASRVEVARMRSLAMVGEMAAGAAHELNNPLAVISGRAQLLVHPDQSEAVQRVAGMIAEHAHRASNIVSELMDYAKPDPPASTAWDIGRFLAELRQSWLDKKALSETQFRLVISDDAGQVWADASQTRKLFDEVIRNAVEAMRETANPQLIINCWLDVADERVVVRVEDNGVGMTADVLERALDPFFSYRPAGRGRGLGLSRAARFAEINGGKLRLASEPEQGTIVLVALPVATQA